MSYRVVERGILELLNYPNIYVLGVCKIPIFICSSLKIMPFSILFQTKSWQDNDMVMISNSHL